MSQKTDPTSLRLQKTNKHFSSSWYSDCFFSQMIANDLQTRSYIEGLSEQIGHSQMFSYIQRYYKRTYTYLFFLDAREIRNQREKVLRLSRKGQKDAASIAASTTFLRSYFDYKEGNFVETTSSMLPRTSLSDNEKDKMSLYSKARHETQLSRVHTSSRKCQADFLWKDDLKKLPAFRSGFNQTLFIQLALNCSIFRDLVVQNSNHQSSNRSGFAKVSATYSTEKSVGTNSVLLIPFSTQICYPLHRDSKSYPNFLKDRDIIAVKKSQLLQDGFVFSVPCLYLNPFHNFCAIGQANLKQRAACFANPWSTNRKGLEGFCKANSPLGSALNIFHGATETAFLLAHPILTSIYPIRVVQDLQFVGFLAQEIAYLLQKGASFKQVQNRILSEHKKNEIIKGIRLSCSGRIGGRSKKAQKSKIQSMQWGETSLHVLSSKLSFASRSANTAFGKIGIKLWLCFQ